MKKKKLFYTLLAILVLAALIPTAYAFMFRKSQTVNNKFDPARVTCEVAETMGTVTKESKEYDAKTSVKVQNTGNVDSYIKVQLIFYWQDSKGVAVYRDAEIPANFIADYINDGWISGGNHTYYYTLPVAPGQSTPELLKQPIVMHPVNEPYKNVDYIYTPVLEIIAEAIQSVPVSAVQDSWDVTITPTTVDGVTTYPITSTQAPKN